MGEKRKIALTVNGKRYEEEVEVRWTLADFIRHSKRGVVLRRARSRLEELVED